MEDKKKAVLNKIRLIRRGIIDGVYRLLIYMFLVKRGR